MKVVSLTDAQVEAIMGAFFMAGGTEQTSDFLRRILLLPEATRHAPPRSPPPYQPPAMGMASYPPPSQSLMQSDV